MKRFWPRSFTIERLRLSMDPLLPVVLLLMAWALSERYYPEVVTLASRPDYWILGGFTALFITVSIVVHELGHSYMAGIMAIPIERIHLYLFGGMAELQHRPHKAGQEFWIAIAGPVASLLLSGVAWLVSELVFTPAHMPYYFFRFLAIINLLIGLFNLLPIFPLDGGRILRSLLWKIKGNYITASRLTRQTGRAFVALLLIGTTTDYLYFQSGYAIIAGILALYMFYTYYTGRYELSYSPQPDELIHIVHHENDTQKMVESIASRRKRVLKRCIFPVLESELAHQVVDGRYIRTESFHIDISAVRTAGEGDYIDLDVPETWHKSVSFNAEWVPVYKNGAFIGMCDAQELRFWIEQNDEITGLLSGIHSP
jgi:Zn-dependent protease